MFDNLNKKTPSAIKNLFKFALTKSRIIEYES